MTPDEQKEYEQFKKWKAQDSEAENSTFQPQLEKIIQQEKTKLNNREPMQIPREYMYAGGAAAIVLILTAWPVLILGAVIGAFAMLKVGCPISNRSKHNDQ